MLRNCKVARVLSRIADCAKNDQSVVLRARFTFYFNERMRLEEIVMLEHWPDDPEIQHSADLYEDMIRRYVSDAVSEELYIEKCGLTTSASVSCLIVSVTFGPCIGGQVSAQIRRQVISSFQPYKGKTMAMIFAKPSMRTRVSFET
ncbi:CLIP-associated protein [Bienertia sinuspersici]